MRFFYEAVVQINQLNSDGSEAKDEVDEDNRKEGGQGDDESLGNPDENVPQRNRAYIWLDAVKAVSEYTHYDWEKVFRMSALEFFSFIAYINFDRRREERRIKALQKKH